MQKITFSRKKCQHALLWLDEIRRLLNVDTTDNSSIYKSYLSNYTKRLQRGYSYTFENNPTRRKKNRVAKAAFHDKTTEVNLFMSSIDKLYSSITSSDSENYEEIAKIIRVSKLTTVKTDFSNIRLLSYSKAFSIEDNIFMSYLISTHNNKLQTAISFSKW